MRIGHITLVGLGLLVSFAASSPSARSTSYAARKLAAAVGADGHLGVVCLGPGEFQGPAVSLAELFATLQDIGTVQAHLQAEIAGIVSAGQPLPPVAELQTTQYLFSGAFTNWSDDVFTEGVSKLAITRGILEMVALHNTYLSGTAIGNADSGATCGPETDGARTADGSCNDQTDTLMGAAGTRFGRNVPLYAAFASEATLLEPNPRKISVDVLRRRGEPKEAGFLNMIGAAWTQFQIHDWFSHGANDEVSPRVSVPLPAQDELRERGLETLEIQRTMPDPTRQPEEAALPSTFLNTVTQWWDGSQLYGSGQAAQDRLRTGRGGKLRLTDDGKLPVGVVGEAETGFSDNWWVGLELLHTVFANEHNAIADMLAANHPDWDDARLFDTARLVNAALMTRIHTLEWTPAILPHPTLVAAMHTNWNGLDQYTSPPFGGTHPHPSVDAIINGIVGNPRQLNGHPYFLTEEFVSVYRMHPMLPEELSLHKASDGSGKGKVPVAESLDAKSRDMIDDHGMADLLYSFGRQNSGSLELNNYPRFLQDIVTPQGIVDVGTIDIVRDRERGIPRFNNARRLLALKPVSSFLELTGDEALAEQLDEAYGGDLEKLDLMVGVFAEGTRPDCFGMSETAFQIFILLATRRLQTDRFYTTDYRPEVYTQEGIDWVEGNTIKDVLLRHYPELAEGLSGTTNAFMPWSPSHRACPPGSLVCADPHVQGLRGQKFDWSGVDGGWYSLIKDDSSDGLLINCRVTAPLPVQFPHRQLMTGISIVSGGHSLVLEVRDPYTIDTDGCPEGVSPCLANGGLRAVVDGVEVPDLLRPSRKEAVADALEISASNLPVECRQFGGDRIWARMYDEMMEGRRRLAEERFEDWVMRFDRMAAPDWCAKFVSENGLDNVQSIHSIFKIATETSVVRLNVGGNTQGNGEVDWDGRVLPDLEFWQMDVGIEGLDVDNPSLSGLLGETARLVLDDMGHAVMEGPGAFRGTVEDYRVAGPLGASFELLDQRRGGP